LKGIKKQDDKNRQADQAWIYLEMKEIENLTFHP
jgi:hypothetical protein